MANVRIINQEILGMPGNSDNLILQTLPAIGLIDMHSFRPNSPSNVLQFGFAPTTVARLAIFAVEDNGVTRAVMLLLPQNAKPNRLLICITQTFAQAARDLNPLGWSNPLSVPFLQFVLLKHVVNRYGPQMLAARGDRALMYITRAQSGNELGPFANNGAFVVDCLDQMISLTNDAFAYDEVEAFTFSSGIINFPTFVSSIAGNVNLRAVYSIDPAHAMDSPQPRGGIRRQFLSGQTGGPRAGFEFMPPNRWVNESKHDQIRSMGLFNYMHNWVMPMYTLNLALQM